MMPQFCFFFSLLLLFLLFSNFLLLFLFFLLLLRLNLCILLLLSLSLCLFLLLQFINLLFPLPGCHTLRWRAVAWWPWGPLELRLWDLGLWPSLAWRICASSLMENLNSITHREFAIVKQCILIAGLLLWLQSPRDNGPE